ncbi:MAG: hypothetical protein ACWA49_16455 [Ruegeria sp.]
MPFRTQPPLSRLLPAFEAARAALVGLVLLAPAGLANTPVANVLPDAQPRGTATFRFLGLPIYDAQLFTQGGAPFNWSQDFGLKLTYRKGLKQKALVDSTIDEMNRQGNRVPIEGQLKTCFQAVSAGDNYLAVSQGPDKIEFWRNGRKTCTLSFPGIKRSFMSIFLGNNTRSAAFTRQLRGQ